MSEKTKNRVLTVLIGVAVAVAGLLGLWYALRMSLPERAPDDPAAESEPPEIVYTLETYAAAHGFTLDDYPERLRELYDKNPDARQFVLEYPLKKDADPAIDLSGEITPGEVPALYQWDERWGYRIYNENVMGVTGCGPTTLSMAVIALTGNAAADPWTMAQYAMEHHYNVPLNGTSWSFIPEGGNAFGLQVQALGLSNVNMARELEAGRLLICCVGPGDFTEVGHFLLISGMENGMYRIHDPNSPSNSAKLWTYDRLVSQIRGLWTLWA